MTHCGRVCFKRQKVNLSTVFAGQNVGVTQVGDRIWLVSFMHYDLGYFDDETCRAGTDRESLRSESVTYVSGMNCHLGALAVFGYGVFPRKNASITGEPPFLVLWDEAKRKKDTAGKNRKQ